MRLAHSLYGGRVAGQLGGGAYRTANQLAATVGAKAL